MKQADVSESVTNILKLAADGEGGSGKRQSNIISVIICILVVKTVIGKTWKTFYWK